MYILHSEAQYKDQYDREDLNFVRKVATGTKG